MLRPKFMMAGAFLACFVCSLTAGAQTIDSLSGDSLRADTVQADTSISIPSDSAGAVLDSAIMGLDSLGLTDTTAIIELPPLPPPVRLIDSLTVYFSRHQYVFDVQQYDLYPRDAAGFLYHEASYFTMVSHETPLRTTVSPFGLPGNRLTVRLPLSEAAPYDRTTPAEGLIDFNDIATGDVARASIIEGPMAGYNSMTGGAAMLYLEPFAIPEGPAESRLTVERGAYGYAYTRGRVARMLSPDLGFAFSTDYRKGDGLLSNGDDDSYNVKFRLFRRFDRQTTLDANVGVYRRLGGYASTRRLRRDEQVTVSVTRQEVWRGQLTGKYNLDLSRSADMIKTIRPRNTYTELSYLRPWRQGLYQLTARFGREQYYINRYYSARYYGFGDLSGLIDLAGGKVLFFGRVRDAENFDLACETSVGYARTLTERWRMVVSGGYLSRYPDLTDLYLQDRRWNTGLTEKSNRALRAEKKLSGNAALFYTADKYELSASFNAGRGEDMIYYDRDYDQYPIIEIIPSNDNITFTDFNLSGSFHDLWWIYGNASATVRKLDSDRYGNRPPYSPRWQVYGQVGLKYFIEHYKVNVRVFGDIAYTERPLSYSMQELQTTAVPNWGINATLKDLTVYYTMHNASNQYHLQPEDYGYTGWFYSWGFNWNFWD